MKLVIPIEQIQDEDRPHVGGKAYALSRLKSAGVNIPKAVCILAEAYSRFVARTGLRERILLELSRKQFKEMRWEEMWDASLRIRNMFLRAPIPAELSDPIRTVVNENFADSSVVRQGICSALPFTHASGNSFRISPGCGMDIQESRPACSTVPSYYDRRKSAL